MELKSGGFYEPVDVLYGLGGIIKLVMYECIPVNKAGVIFENGYNMSIIRP